MTSLCSLGTLPEQDLCEIPAGSLPTFSQVSGSASREQAAKFSPAAPARGISAAESAGELFSLSDEGVLPMRTISIPAGGIISSNPVATDRNTISESQECESSFNRTLCPLNTPRSDLTNQSSRRSTHRQTKAFELTRSGPFPRVRRTLRFSRFDSRRKVSYEKRNANQRSSTRGKPNCHC